MGLEPGYHVSKYVRLVRRLRHGGMGSVWVAEHLALQTQVAVKFISREYADDPSMVTRFKREATSAAQIKSPHVVQIHDHGVTADGEPFIVMELLEGEDLWGSLRRARRMSLSQVAVVVQQMCRVLAKAHRLGIIHRDIKPSNIFLVDTDGDLFLKLLDFGVAKMGDEQVGLTTTGATVGTMGYMSPEQLMNARRVDHRADLWSLAVVAYRAITGKLPFDDEDGIGAFCKALEQGKFTPPSQLVPGLPPGVDVFFERAFQVDPAARFASAREMADDFFLAIGEPAMGAPPSTARGVALLEGSEDPPSNAARTEAQSDGARPALTAPPDRTLSAAGVVPSPQRADDPSADLGASAPGARDLRPARAEDPASTGAASARTVAGGEAPSALVPKPRSGLRRALFAVLTLAVLAGGALAGARFLYPERFNLPVLAPHMTSDPPAPSTPAGPPSPPSAPVVVVTPSATADAADPVPTATATSGSSAAPAASASARPSATASPGIGKPRPRPKKGEKDYGF